MSRPLSEIYANRLNWAWEARKDFIRDVLDMPELAGALEPQRPIAVFYGGSQVGKTGIILRLLGIEENNHKQLEYVLRGGREYGNSATATAIQYTRSESDDWVIKQPNCVAQKCSNKEDARNEFMKLREIVCREGTNAHRVPVQVALPSSLFPNEAWWGDKLPVIIDLPGEFSSDTHEHKHVNQMLAEWLSIATVVVMVAKLGEIQGIGSFTFGNRTGDWFCWPGELILATTFSCSADSMKKVISEIESLDLLIKNIKEQYRTDSNSERERITSLTILPFEYGESFSNFQRVHPKLHEKFQPWLNESKDRLRKAIQKTASMETALLGLSGVRAALERTHEKRVLDAKKQVAQLRAQLKGIEDEYIIDSEKLTEQIKYFTNQIQRIEKVKGDIDDWKEEIQNEIFAICEKKYVFDYLLIQKTSEMKSRGYDIASLIHKKFLSSLANSHIVKDSSRDSLSKSSYDGLQEYISTGGYTGGPDKYWFDSSKKSDYYRMRQNVNYYCNSLNKKIRKICERELHELEKDREKFINEKNFRENEFEKVNKKYIKEKGKSAKQLSDAMIFLDEKVKEKNSAMKEVKEEDRFLQYLKRVYSEKYKSLIDSLRTRKKKSSRLEDRALEKHHAMLDVLFMTGHMRRFENASSTAEVVE